MLISVIQCALCNVFIINVFSGLHALCIINRFQVMSLKIIPVFVTAGCRDYFVSCIFFEKKIDCVYINSAQTIRFKQFDTNLMNLYFFF